MDDGYKLTTVWSVITNGPFGRDDIVHGYYHSKATAASQKATGHVWPTKAYTMNGGITCTIVRSGQESVLMQDNMEAPDLSGWGMLK